MWIVIVLDDDYTTGREFAKRLASRLGYRFVDAEALVERAVASRGNRKKLRRICERAPRFTDRLTLSKDVHVLQLRAALAKNVQEGNVICYGIAADLLDVRAGHILRVRVKASYDSRLRLAQQRKNLDSGEAQRILREGQKSRDRWRKYLLWTKPCGPGLLINLDETSVDEACATVRDMIECLDRHQPVNADLRSIRKWVLCAAVRAAIVQSPQTRHLNAGVTVEGDAVVLDAIPPVSDGGSFPPRFPASVGAAIQTAFAQYPETRQLLPQMTIQGDRIVLRGILEDVSADPAPEPAPGSIEAQANHSPTDASAREAAVDSDRGPGEPLRHPRPLLARAGVLLRPAVWGSVGGAVLMFLLIYGSLSSRKKLEPSSRALSQAFSGVITDTNCGVVQRGQQSSAECVRSCVRSGGAKYALSEAGRLIVISNQPSADAFAAQRVMVTGALNPKNGELQITSIRIAGP